MTTCAPARAGRKSSVGSQKTISTNMNGHTAGPLCMPKVYRPKDKENLKLVVAAVPEYPYENLRRYLAIVDLRRRNDRRRARRGLRLRFRSGLHGRPDRTRRYGRDRSGLRPGRGARRRVLLCRI